jgi:hypothetical protein
MKLTDKKCGCGIDGPSIRKINDEDRKRDVKKIRRR